MSNNKNHDRNANANANANPKPKIKAKPNNYWTPETTLAIERYQSSPEAEDKETLFLNIIYPAFLKLSQYWVHSYNLPDTSPEDVCTHLYQQLPKFKKGNNSFAYFGTCAKFYLLRKKEKHLKNSNNKSIEDSLFLMPSDSSTERDYYNIIWDDSPVPVPEELKKEIENRMEYFFDPGSTCGDINDISIKKQIFSGLSNSQKKLIKNSMRLGRPGEFKS